MDCPKCFNSTLQESLGPKGVVADLCRTCYGLWFDKGELYYYVSDPKRTHAYLQEAYQSTRESKHECPRCKVAMREVDLKEASIVIEACPRCGGNWFDEGEIVQLNRALGASIDVRDPHYLSAVQESPPEQPTAQDVPSIGSGDSPPRSPEPAPATLQFATAAGAGAAGAAWKAMAGRPLAALPSLAMRSWGVLAGLYGVLAAFMFVVVTYFKMDPSFAFGFAALAIILNFLLGPFFTDLSLSWLHKMRWVKPEDLPSYLREFIAQAFEKEKYPFPRIGIIEDGNPNAFTYGHYPGNARIILTRGLFEILDEEEAKAVAAHEIGHVMHWDMAVMTMAALVPIILYYIYRFCMRASRRRRSSSSGKGGNPLPLIGLAALLLYYITEYIVLFLSRVREYYADRYSGELTRKPNALSSALIKIAYGLAGRRDRKKEDEGRESSMSVGAAKTLGIFDATSAKALVAASLGEEGKVSTANILGAMQWDLWNPWALYYEINSTHPLTAKRIERLGEQAASYGQQPLVHFALEQPESYWDEFFVDLFFAWLPILMVGGSVAALFLAPGMLPLEPAFLNAIGAFCLGYIARTAFSYKAGFYPDMAVSSLLKRVKVSRVRGIPAKLEGKIIGRGIPGYILSEDLVLQDETGFIFIDYEQPLALFNLLFAVTRGRKLDGKEVVVEGWYRRAPVPFFEIRRIRHAEGENKCWTLEAKYVFSILAVLFCVWASMGMPGVF